MKKRGIIVIAVLTLLTLGFSGPAQAAGLLTLTPGGSTIREFQLYDEFDYRSLRPMETFLILGFGSDENLLGDMTIQLKPSITRDFGAVVEFGLIGLAYSLGGRPVFISADTAAPLTLTKTIPMSAAYGLVLVGAYIKNITGDVLLPAPFTITFSWATGE